ncbi:MAG: glycosyltransferase family 2 protein [Dehalococcoidia bacterium]|nr:glycosyltransferase family 2 protein [Dehalococcoidia bacterium]
MNASPDISIVIVSWNVAGHLRDCLLSVQAEERLQPGLSVEVIIVDNASADGTVDMLASEFSGVTTISNDRNLGFAAACNQGMASSSAEYVLLLNPDTLLLPGFIRRMLEYIQVHPEAAAVGPKLLNTDHTVQPSRRRFPTLATALIESTIVQSWFPDLPRLRRFYVKDIPDTVAQEVDWLVGACILLRREALRVVGPLDERFFMYFEELDWFYRANAFGWKGIYLPEAEVIHHYGQSSAQDLARRHSNFNSSKCKFYAKHWGAAIGVLLRFYLIATFGLQLVEEAAKLALGHKRELRIQRLRLLLGVLRTGLR